MGQYIASRAALPTPQLEAWIIANPDKAAQFDVDFGPGAAARILAKANKPQKPAR
jgi:hypothetical protein